MPWTDDLITKAVVGTGGIFGIKWLIQVWRFSKKDFQGDQSESQAIKNLKSEVERLAVRVGKLESELDMRDAELKELQQEVDDQRTLRRLAEDALDKECRRSASLEDQIAELERRT